MILGLTYMGYSRLEPVELYTYSGFFWQPFILHLIAVRKLPYVFFG